MANQAEVIDLRYEAGGATADAVRSANSIGEAYEKSAQRASAAMEGAANKSESAILRIVDRSRLGSERIIASIEKRVSALKSPIDQLVAQRAQALDRIGGDPKGIERINTAFSALIANQKQIDIDQRLDRAAAASRNAAKEADVFQAALARVNKEQAKQKQSDYESGLNAAIRASKQATTEANSFQGALARVNKEQAKQKQSDYESGLNAAIRASKQATTEANSFQGALARVNREQKQLRDSTVANVERRVQGLQSPLAQLQGQRTVDLKNVAGDPAAVQRVTAAYRQLIAAEQERSNGLRGVGENIRNFLESPIESTKNAVIGLVEKLGPAGVLLAGVVGGIAAAAAAGFEAAKSLGEYGNQVRDAGLRTGLSAKEFGQFAFAARASGEDVGVFERIMRGLTEAMTDNSKAGSDARETLKKLGVEPRDLEGNLKPTSRILLEISEGLRKLPAGFERNKAALDIFKRAGIEAVPVMTELSENVAEARRLGFGPTEEEIDRFNHYQQTVATASEKWDRLVRSIREFIATPVVALLDDKGINSRIPDASDFESRTGKLRQFLLGNQKSAASVASQGLGAIQERINNELEKQAKEAIAGPGTSLLTGALKAGLEGANAELTRLKQKYDDARAEADKLVVSGGALPKIAHQHLDELDKARAAYQKQSELVKILERDESKRISNLEKMRDLIRQGQGFLRIGSGFTEAIVSEQELNDANKPVRKTPSLLRREESNPFRAVQQSQFEQKQLADLKPGLQVDRGGVVFISPESERAGGIQRLPSGEAVVPGQGEGALAHVLELRAQQDRDSLTALSQEREATIQLLELRTGPGGEFETARKVAALREDGLKQELQFTGDVSRYRQESLQNEIDLRLKIAEIEKRQLDSIKQETQGLLHTLFTDAKSFGRQFGTALRDAALKPIEEGLSNVIANILKPTIFGQGGQGGIAGQLRGIFGQKQQPQFEFSTKLDSPNHLGDVQLRSGAVPVYLANAQDVQQQKSGLSSLPFGLSGATAALAAVLGLGALGGVASAAPTGVVQSTIDFGGFAGSSPITGPGQVFGADSIFGGPGGTPGFAGDLTGRGTTGFTGLGIPGSAPTTTPPFVDGTAGPSQGGILGSLKNILGFKGILSSLGGIGMGGGLASSLPVGIGGDTAAAAGGIPGLGQAAPLGDAAGGSSAIGGAAGGALLLGGGIAAFDGLRRGGIGGLIETTAGGAAIGAKFGGPVGALIGAGVGALAGTIRLFIKSGAEKVVSKVKAIYGIDIDKKFAQDPILGIIKQNFGGNVEVGLRSPQIRDLLELYATTTDQKSAGIVNRVQQSTFANQSGSLVNIPNVGLTGAPVGFSGGSAIGNGITFGLGTGSGPQFAPAAAPAAAPQSLNVTLKLDGASTKTILQGQAVEGIKANPRAVSTANNDGLMTSAARRSTAASVLQPNFITG